MDESKKINMNNIIIKNNLLNSVKNNKINTSAKYKIFEPNIKLLKMKKLAVKFLNFKHNTTERIYNTHILNYIIYKHNCQLVASFKDHMIFDSIEEFLKRPYTTKESLERMPRISKYFKNYSEYFCKPLFRDLNANEIIGNYWEGKAELFYKKNLNGGDKKKEDERKKERKKDKKPQHFERILNTIANNLINEPEQSISDTLRDLSRDKIYKDTYLINNTDFGLVSTVSRGSSFNSFLNSFTGVKITHHDNKINGHENNLHIGDNYNTTSDVRDKGSLGLGLGKFNFLLIDQSRKFRFIGTKVSAEEIFKEAKDFEEKSHKTQQFVLQNSTKPLSNVNINLPKKRKYSSSIKDLQFFR